MRSLLERLILLVLAVGGLGFRAYAGIIYVNRAATGANNGTSWQDAFTELRVALPTTVVGDQVWVAAGEYRPAPPGGSTMTPFVLRGIRLYGGFNGTESNVEQRNWRTQATTLSGDLNSNDGGWGGSDNSKVIVRVEGLGDCTIDGFNIVGVNASENYSGTSEGAVVSVLSTGGRLNLQNCWFTRNSGRCVLLLTYPADDDVIANCVFQNNRSSGGTLRSDDFHGGYRFQLVHCTVVGNQVMPGGTGPSAAAGVNVKNSILWSNTMPALANTGYAGAVAEYSNIDGGFAGPGNIYADPRFENIVSGDYRLLSISPCIDAGSNAAIPAWLTLDFDRNPRRLEEPGTANTGQGVAPMVDMGAHEFVPDCDGNGQPDTVDIATGAAVDLNGNHVLDICERTGTAICIGDGSGNPCPCANPSTPGFEAGCANSSARAGRLTAFGVPALAEDTLVLSVQGLGTTAPALYFQGDGLDLVGGVGGLPFGDGLRCVYGTIHRLGIRISANGGSTFGDGAGSEPLISVRGVLPPWGGTRHYQVWYRDAVPFCTPAAYNLSNALTIVWGA